MAEIPPTKPTDPEDVVWGLQTADTLWRRGERIDALVWLRRAAQAAGDANDDDRALELARFAAELTEFMNAEEAPELVDDDLIEDLGDSGAAAPTPLRPPPPDDDDGAQHGHASGPSLEASEAEVDTSDLGIDDEDAARAPRHTPSVPPAERLHAGILDPWAEMSSRLPPPEALVEPPRAPESEEEVVTSARPNALARQRSEVEIPPSSRVACRSRRRLRRH